MPEDFSRHLRNQTAAGVISRHTARYTVEVEKRLRRIQTVPVLQQKQKEQDRFFMVSGPLVRKQQRKDRMFPCCSCLTVVVILKKEKML